MQSIRHCDQHRARPGVALFAAGVLLLPAFCVATATAGTPMIDWETGSSLVTNMKAYKLGDVVTIIIVENSSANAISKTDANTKTEIKGGPGLGVLDVFSQWGLDTENKFKGDGKTTRTGNLRAEITARIIEAMPNGDFVLSGTRMVDINGERQLIEISGICRARDIAADNTILSTYIADAQIAYNGTGHVNNASEPGIISKLVNWLF